VRSGQAGKIKVSKAIEVGNIFPLGTMYAQKMNAFYTNSKGQKLPLWLASYGIGPTRVLGTLVEVFHDDKGIIWPKSVSPYSAHLIHIENSGIKENAKKVYETLEKEGIEVLWDDRIDVSVGEKFADADLIGISVRLVISEKSAGKIEWKQRNSEKTELLNLEEVIKRLK
jgi:prolyl-tRNA synthetase